MEIHGLDPQLIAAIVGGVIGILGSIATIIASHFLRVAGRITVNVSGSDLQLVKLEHGVEVEAKSLADAYRFGGGLGVDIYNSSDVPRSLRKVQIEIKSKRNRKSAFSSALVYVAPPLGTAYALAPYKPLDIINLAPKQLQHISCRCWYEKKDITDFEGIVLIYLNALYPNGRRFKVHLLTTHLNGDA